MFETVNKFEKAIAEYYGAPYAVAVDSCTHAIELSLRYLQPQTKITIPSRTYISVPFTLEKLGLDWGFQDIEWTRFYPLGNTRIIDAATMFEKNSYVANMFMCLSFQHKKALGLGRGGAILCPSERDYTILKQMAYDGRTDDKPWGEQNIKFIGYHYYMTPETAQLGLDKISDLEKGKIWSSDNYPYLPDMDVFK
jgi:dTDP-4-amino-4,6-dideoxygalactose transaminase